MLKSIIGIANITKFKKMDIRSQLNEYFQQVTHQTPSVLSESKYHPVSKIHSFSTPMGAGVDIGAKDTILEAKNEVIKKR